KLCADYEGVKSVARQVLRHRIITNFNARAQKVSVDDVIGKVLGEVRPETQ
ncbi:MAG: AAA family ATPase, partial [Verrucomicrobia bacterium]